MGKPHGEPHLSNTRWGKRVLSTYDGHARRKSSTPRRALGFWKDACATMSSPKRTRTSILRPAIDNAELVDGSEFFANEILRWNEKTFQSHVLRLAKDFGWTHRFHTYFSDRSEAGYPDVHLLRPSTKESIYVEFKTMKGKLSAAQESWRDALLACGLRWYIWRPDSWNSGEIEQVLM